MLTPKQFHLLWDRHREALLHQELCNAYTSAALYNLLGAPEEPIPESAFMPNLKHSSTQKQPEPLTVTEQSAVDDYRSQRANLAALLEAYQATGIADPQLIAIGLVHG